MRPQSLVAYYVAPPLSSPDRPGTSLSDQRSVARRFELNTSYEITSEYTETVSRRCPQRPALADAISHAERANALLLVVQFGLIARDLRALSLLVSSGTDFITCDFPHANKATLPLLAEVVAEESRHVSRTTKQALTKRKQHSTHGKPASVPNTRKSSQITPSNQRAAWNRASELGPRLQYLRDEGKTLRQIAEIVAAEGYVTKSGQPWTHTHIRRVLARYKNRLGPMPQD